MLLQKQELVSQFDQQNSALILAFESASAADISGLSSAALAADFDQSQLAALGADVAVVHYLVTDERLRILATTGQERLAREFAISRNELNRRIFSFRDLVQRPNRDPRLEAPLAARHAAISAQAVTLALEKKAIADIDESVRTPAQKVRLAALDAQFDEISTQMTAFLAEVDMAFATQNRATGETFGDKQTAELDTLQETLRGLNAGTVLVQYFVTPERLRILVTTPDTKLFRDSPITEADLNRRVTAFRTALKDPRLDPRPQAQVLHEVMIAPIADLLKQAEAKLLMVSLDRTLRYVPVAALHDGKSWLIEKYGLAMYTAAAGTSLDKPPVAEWRVAGLGVSSGGVVEGLPFTELPAVPEELTGIVRQEGDVATAAGVLPGIRRLDTEFTAQSLVEAIRKNYPVLHIASHFRFSPTEAGGSYLLLGEGQKLTLDAFRTGDNYKLPRVDLLTLSACETAMGASGEDGSEVEGFGALAQKRGAKAVLATLWSIADGTTGIFMQGLYAQRQQGQLTKAEALRRTQLAFISGQSELPLLSAGMRGGQRGDVHNSNVAAAERWVIEVDKPYAHPFYWAPFILMGNWL